jgi:hypothetical protein
VKVGSPFTTTITITNPFACEVTNVTLADAVRSESAARFSFASTTPSVTAPGGSGLATGALSWAVGSIAPGASKSVKVVLGAEGGAGKILDTATASGTLANCPAKPGSASADVTGLAAVNVPVTGVGSLQVPVAQVLGERFLPKLGIADTASEGIGVGLLILAAGLAFGMRRRRKIV